MSLRDSQRLWLGQETGHNLETGHNGREMPNTSANFLTLITTFRVTFMP